MRKSLWRILLVLSAVLLLEGAGPALGAEIPRCSKLGSISDPEIRAPKKVAAGREFEVRYALNVKAKGDISPVFVRFLNKKGKTKHLFRPYYNHGYIEPTIELSDGKSRFRVEWIEITKNEDGEKSRCRDSIETSVRPWKGKGATFKVGYPSGGEVVWRLRDGQKLCGGKRRLQATTDYYQLRIRGANGNLRSTVGEICDGFERTTGKRSGKWDIYYSYSSRSWHFYPNASNLPPGVYHFRWAIFRGKKEILHGRFGIEAIVR